MITCIWLFLLLYHNLPNLQEYVRILTRFQPRPPPRSFYPLGRVCVCAGGGEGKGGENSRYDDSKKKGKKPINMLNSAM